MNKKYTTSDLGLASYLMLKGVKLISATRAPAGYQICFDDSADVCNTHAVDYVNSDFLRYDTYSKNLRILLKTR